MLHGEETEVFADSGYRGVEKRKEVQIRHPNVNWHIAMRPGKRRALKKDTPMSAILDKLEQTKARIRTKVEHPFWSSSASSATPRSSTGDWPRTRPTW